MVCSFMRTTFRSSFLSLFSVLYTVYSHLSVSNILRLSYIFVTIQVRDCAVIDRKPFYLRIDKTYLNISIRKTIKTFGVGVVWDVPVLSFD
ncbi:hypothetical protein QTP88_022229 [Uroleucon formosanum]